MRHIIEVEERIEDYDSRIDRSDYIEHYSTCYDNSMYRRRIEALKFFIQIEFNEEKLNNFHNSTTKNIKELEEALKKTKDYSKRDKILEELDIHKRYFWEYQWVVTETELPARYRSQIKNWKKQIKNLQKRIEKKENLLKEMGIE